MIRSLWSGGDLSVRPYAQNLCQGTHRTYRKVADKSRAYKDISRFLHQALMQTRLVCKPCLYAPLIFLPGLYARLLRATCVDLPLTTGMAAVLPCTVHSACTLDPPDPRLHRSQASTRDTRRSTTDYRYGGSFTMHRT